MPSFADGIVWEAAQNISNDTDVRTNGVLRYAYARNALTVNGVQFTSGASADNTAWNYLPENAETVADVSLACTNGSCKVTTQNGMGLSSPATGSTEYTALLKGFYYTTAQTRMTVTLKNLIPGHAYIVQLWVHDPRSDATKARRQLVDETEVMKYYDSAGGAGQHITGSFTATDATQTFTLDPYSDLEGGTGSAQFGAIQLRDVTPGQIEWEDAKNIADDSDVRTDGECVFAAGWTAATAIVNNVVFVPLAPTNSTTEYVDVRMNTELLTWYRTATFNTDITQTLSDEYHRLIGGATYPSAQTNATVTLKGLVAGGRYLVQLWVNDTRTTIGPYRFQEIDGGKRMSFAAASGTYGQHITGVFTADGTEKSLKIIPLYKPTSKVTSGNPQVNAIQLRRLDSGATTHWRVSPITKRDLDVRLEGDLLYAYNFSKTATDTTINGVMFSGVAQSVVSGNTSSDFAFVTPKFGNGNDTVFGITDSGTTSEYLTMLKSAVYSSGGSNDETPSTLTLKRLTPGHRYLVQLWVHDGRSISSYGDRYMTLDGVATVEYKNEGLFSPARGDVATGLFTATAETQTITMVSGHYSNSADRCVHFNGMQVRDLGEPEGLSILVEDIPFWHVAADATTDLDGAARSIGLASGEGSITNGTLSTVLEVADGSDITLDAVTLAAGVALDGASSVTFAGDADLTGLAVHIADPAAAMESGRTVLSVEGTMTGEPTFTFGTGGYKVKRTAGNGYTVGRITGLMFIVR